MMVGPRPEEEMTLSGQEHSPSCQLADGGEGEPGLGEASNQWLRDHAFESNCAPGRPSDRLRAVDPKARIHAGGIGARCGVLTPKVQNSPNAISPGMDPGPRQEEDSTVCLVGGSDPATGPSATKAATSSLFTARAKAVPEERESPDAGSNPARIDECSKGTVEEAFGGETDGRSNGAVSEAFPTEGALRAKEKLKAKKKQLEDAGDEEGIKALKRRKPQEQEQHFDDCGSDTTPLEEWAVRSEYAGLCATLDDSCEHAFWGVDDACSTSRRSTMRDFWEMWRAGSAPKRSSTDPPPPFVCGRISWHC